MTSNPIFPRRIRLAALLGCLFSVGLVALSASCRGAEISDRFLDALALVESGNNPGAVGKRGELGAYQMTKAAGKPTRQYARAYCLWLDAQLARALRRPATVGEVYAAYNLGPTGFKRRGNKLSNCPAATRDAAKRLENLL